MAKVHANVPTIDLSGDKKDDQKEKTKQTAAAPDNGKPAAATPPPASAPVKETPPQTVMVKLELPVDDRPPARQFALHLDVRVEPRLATALRRLTGALDRAGEKTAGSRVTRPTQALKWMLDKFADAVGGK